MTPLDAALAYASRRSWPVFPCDREKRPLVEGGFRTATTDHGTITAWWRRWPTALIGTPTGRGFVVLDVDVKHPPVNGFDTLADLDFAILPSTPMLHTTSGGLHLYFDPGEDKIYNTAGERGSGIGPGLDWRGIGGYVIVPAPGSGYHWDPVCNLATVPFAPVRSALLPRPPERQCSAQPVERTSGLSPYAEAALDSACCAIVAAPAGEQERTIVGECFSIGTLAGAGGIPAELARRILLAAARRIPDYDPRRKWRASEIEKKVDRAFDAGLCHPRGAIRAA
jgi:hypothetical protein